MKLHDICLHFHQSFKTITFVPLLNVRAAKDHEEDCGANVKRSIDQENVSPLSDCALELHKNYFIGIVNEENSQNLFSCEVTDNHR